MEEQTLKKMIWLNFNINIITLVLCAIILVSIYVKRTAYQMIAFLLIGLIGSLYLAKWNKTIKPLL